jgi:hypothetical protein
MTDRETFDAPIMAHGNSLTINCTKQVKRLGLQRGDTVKVTLERIPNGEEAPPED